MNIDKASLSLLLLLLLTASSSAFAQDTVEDSSESAVPQGEDALMAAHPVDVGQVSFKPGKGLEVKSSDGAFALTTRVRLQLLYTVLKEDGVDTMNELKPRRVRLVLNGNAFGKHNKYKFELDALSSTPVLDYYLDFGKYRNLTLRMGQYKIASNRTRVISSGNLQFVDRSIVNGEFTLDRDVGFDLRSKDLFGLDRFRYYLGLSLGQGKNNPSFQDFGMLYLARVEYLPMGSFNDYSEADFERTGPRLSIGGAYTYFDRAASDRGNIGTKFADGGTADYQQLWLDAIFKFAGFSAVSEFMYRTGTRDPGPITTDEDGNAIVPIDPRVGWGFMAQAGYLIPRQPIEVVARMGMNRGTSSSTSLSDRNEVGGGLGWYIGRHALKVQLDVFQLWNEDVGEGDTRARLQVQASL